MEWGGGGGGAGEGVVGRAGEGEGGGKEKKKEGQKQIHLFRNLTGLGNKFTGSWGLCVCWRGGGKVGFGYFESLRC